MIFFYRALCLLLRPRLSQSLSLCAATQALMRKGQCLEKLERYAEASADMAAALALDPSSRLARERKARCDKLEAERVEKLKAVGFLAAFRPPLLPLLSLLEGGGFRLVLCSC